MPDIAVFVLDTLRKDSFDRHFDWLPGTRFEQTYAPSHYTVPVHAGLFTGKYPSSVGVGAKHEVFDCAEESIVEQLQKAGYTTSGFSANALLTPQRKFDRGFDKFETGWRVQLMDEDVFGWSRAAQEIPNGHLRDLRAVWRCIQSDCDTVRSLRLGYKQKFADHDGGRQVLERARRGKFADDNFLFVNLMEAHSPYRAPDDYEIPEGVSIEPETILEGDVDLSGHRDQYEVAVEWLSDLYQQIFEEVRDDFDYVFTLADHGELFGEHGARGHFHGVYPELVHVPLCVTGLDEATTDTSPRSLLDVHRTIAEIAGISADSEGVDLRTSPNDRDIFVEYHGFREMRMQQLQRRGFSESEVKKYNQPLVGYISEPNKYSYQYVNSDGNVSSNGRSEEVLKERNSYITAHMKNQSGGQHEVSEAALDQLRDLGYA